MVQKLERKCELEMTILYFVPHSMPVPWSRSCQCLQSRHKVQHRYERGIQFDSEFCSPGSAVCSVQLAEENMEKATGSQSEQRAREHRIASLFRLPPSVSRATLQLPQRVGD